MAYWQTLKLGMDKLWKNAEAKGYMIFSVFGEMFVFTNIFGFPGVYKLAPKIYL